MHLRGDPIGLSLGRLAVINKSLVLSVCPKNEFCLFACFFEGEEGGGGGGQLIMRWKR